MRSTRPWEHATGPTTPEGKARASMNAAAFRNDPKARHAYRALQLILKNPCPAVSALLWAEIDAMKVEVDYRQGNGNVRHRR